MAEPWAPDQATIAKLERGADSRRGRSTQYPDGHVPAVTDYGRYYTGEAFDGRKMVFAELVSLARGRRSSRAFIWSAAWRPFPRSPMAAAASSAWSMMWTRPRDRDAV